MARPSALAVALSALFLTLAPSASPAPPASRVATYHAKCTRLHAASFHKTACRHRRGHVRHHGASHALFFVAHNGRCPDTNLAPTPRNIALVRAAALCLINRERSSHGEQPLRWNDRLISAAQAHTTSMAFGDYFAHMGPGGQTPLLRMRRTGYLSSTRGGFEVGENIGWGSLWLGTPRAIVAGWMRSAGHRANILDRRFRDTGIGVSAHLGRLAHGQQGGIYTQDFGVVIH